MLKVRFHSIFMMTIVFLCFATVTVADPSGGSPFFSPVSINSNLTSDAQVAFLATPDVQEVIQYSCIKCYVDAGLTFTDELYTIRDNSMNTATENITVVKGVVDYLPDIELKRSGLSLNKEWSLGSGRDLTLGVVNTAYSEQRVPKAT